MAYAENITLIPKSFDTLDRNDYKSAKATHALAGSLLIFSVEMQAFT